MSDHGEHGKKPRRRRSFTPEFKAEIVELCHRGDRSVGQVAKDFDLTETAVREWVKQAERDTGTRQDGGLTTAERQELRIFAAKIAGSVRMWRSLSGPRLLRQGDPVNIYPFIEAEKRRRRNVKRACELLRVSRAAFYQHLSGPSRRDREDAELASQIQAVHEGSKGRYGAPPRVHPELRRQGTRHGRKRIARLMRQAGIAGRPVKRRKKTTIPDPAATARTDLIAGTPPPAPRRSTPHGAGTSPIRLSSRLCAARLPERACGLVLAGFGARRRWP